LSYPFSCTIRRSFKNSQRASTSLTLGALIFCPTLFSSTIRQSFNIFSEQVRAEVSQQSHVSGTRSAGRGSTSARTRRIRQPADLRRQDPGKESDLLLLNRGYRPGREHSSRGFESVIVLYMLCTKRSACHCIIKYVHNIFANVAKTKCTDCTT
jgi:hypothetical protein